VGEETRETERRECRFHQGKIVNPEGGKYPRAIHARRHEWKAGHTGRPETSVHSNHGHTHERKAGPIPGYAGIECLRNLRHTHKYKGKVSLIPRWAGTEYSAHTSARGRCASYRGVPEPSTDARNPPSCPPRYKSSLGRLNRE
jgi:hypothetical protein